VHPLKVWGYGGPINRDVSVGGALWEGGSENTVTPPPPSVWRGLRYNQGVDGGGGGIVFLLNKNKGYSIQGPNGGGRSKVREYRCL
jgi:hypothetical protein